MFKKEFFKDIGVSDFLSYELYTQDDYSLTIGAILLIVLLFFLTKFILSILKNVLNKAKSRSNIGSGRVHSLYQIIKYIVWLLAIVLMLQSVGIKITLLLAGSAALLVGLGFGLQQIFGDVVSGIGLLFEGSIKIGDILQIDKGALVGRVIAINLRTSKIITRDGIVIIIPNHKFINENVINWTSSENATRFKISVGVSYGSDVEKVKAVLLECANEHKDVIRKIPHLKPIVWLNNFGNSSLDFELLFWSKNVFMIENTMSEIRFTIYHKFHEKNIKIPFPQLDIHNIQSPN